MKVNELKCCNKCGVEKPFDQFHKQKQGLHGLRGQCKACHSEYRSSYLAENRGVMKEKRAMKYRENAEAERRRVADWRAANADKVRALSQRSNEKSKARRKQWAIENREGVRRASAEHYQRNKDEVKTRSQLKRLANPEKAVIATMKWRSKHPGYGAAIERNRRARVRLAKGRHSIDEVHELLRLQKGKCPICKGRLGRRYHVDHIVAIASGGSNDWTNLQLLHPRCNQSKSAKDPIDFMQQRGYLL